MSVIALRIRRGCEENLMLFDLEGDAHRASPNHTWYQAAEDIGVC